MVVAKIDYQRCNDCLKCYRICPMDVYRVAGRSVYLAYADDCMCCYLCELECPRAAIYVHPSRPGERVFPW